MANQQFVELQLAAEQQVSLSMLEKDLHVHGRHVLMTYLFDPKVGFDYLGTAAQAAAFGSRVPIFSYRPHRVMGYYVVVGGKQMEILPCLQGRSRWCSITSITCPFLTLATVSTHGWDSEHDKFHDSWVSSLHLRLLDVLAYDATGVETCCMLRHCGGVLCMTSTEVTWIRIGP